jgi:hypothetical protein
MMNIVQSIGFSLRIEAQQTTVQRGKGIHFSSKEFLPSGRQAKGSDMWRWSTTALGTELAFPMRTFSIRYQRTERATIPRNVDVN